ncbi:MAG: GH3 family domain-containing protein [Flavobacteriales bacterium]
MYLKKVGAKLLAKKAVKRIKKWAAQPVTTQQEVFQTLIKEAKNTVFGKEHHFSKIKTHQDFIKNVPVRDYEGLKHYFERTANGEENILWKGTPTYIAKTSGTTSGAKYIPITKDAMPFHIEAAKNALFSYIEETNNADFVNGKMIFLQGSPVLEEKNRIKIGRLSGIVAHFVPKYLQKNRLPSWKTNCIEDWETKVDAIVEETKKENMTLISGIPSWVQMYFERLQAATNKSIGDLFPNFNLFVYGGVNYEPYRAKFEKMIGKKVDSIELYPASEGFFAFQDSQTKKGMLLLLNSGIFYEFIEASTFYNKNPKRLTIGEVKTGVNYVIIISTNAGLWAYNIGDTIMFTSTKPYRVMVTGRIKHFISAFGEHVIGKEVEQAIKEAMEQFQFSISEFTVAPQTNPPEGGLPYHEWFVEFENTPQNIKEIALFIDELMQKQNTYYYDLIKGKVLQNLKIRVLKPGSFNDYMKSQGKLGGQNKVPRLSDNRKIVDWFNKGIYY